MGRIKRKKRKNPIKAYQTKALNLWYMLVKRRDKECQIHKFFPIKCYNYPILQAHHIFSKSKHRNICLDLENGITLCSGCHTALSFGNDAYREMVRIIAEKKGKEIYERLFEQSQMSGPHLCWKSISWLEDQIEVLEQLSNP